MIWPGGVFRDKGANNHLSGGLQQRLGQGCSTWGRRNDHGQWSPCRLTWKKLVSQVGIGSHAEIFAGSGLG